MQRVSTKLYYLEHILLKDGTYQCGEIFYIHKSLFRSVELRVEDKSRRKHMQV